MKELLSELYANSATPIWSAVLLGLMTAISPCPLATNITALGFVSKDISNKRKVFLNGIVYMLGRTISYVLLAMVIIYGAEQFHFSVLFQRYSEKVLGILLIIIGLFMLGIFNINLPFFDKVSKRYTEKAFYSYWEVFLVGVVFALAFCPYSGILYFGLLIPLSVESSWGLSLPLVFAIATGIPVILFSWLLAYAFSHIGNLYSKIQNFEKWFRKFVAILFIIVGIYYCIITFISL